MSATASQPTSPSVLDDQIVEHLTNQQVEDITKEGGYLSFLDRIPGYQLLSFRRPTENEPLAVNVIIYRKRLV